MENTHLLILSRQPTQLAPLRSILDNLGYSSASVEDISQALKEAAVHPPELILSHLAAPEDIQTLTALRRAGLMTAAVLVASVAVQSVPTEALRLGVCDYLWLPAEEEQVRQIVSRNLTAGRLQPQQILLEQQLSDTRQELERQTLTLTTLYGLGRSLSRTLDTDKLLHRVLEAVIHLVPADEASVRLTNSVGRPVDVRLSRSAAAAEAPRLRVEDSLADMVIQTGQPLMINDADEVQGAGREAGQVIHALLNVPLRMWDRPVGVLSIVNKTSPANFGEEDRLLLSILADYTAISLENAHVLRDSQHSAGLEMFRQTVATLSHYINNPLTAVIAGVHATLKHLRASSRQEESEPVLENLRLIEHKLREIGTVMAVLQEVVVPTSTQYWREEKMIDIEKHLKQRLQNLNHSSKKK